MSVRHYRLFPLVAASAALLVAGCGVKRPTDDAIEVRSRLAVNTQKQVAADPEGMDTEATILTVLGLAKKPSRRTVGPQVGDEVSPSLWNATHDTLSFLPIASEDMTAGFVVTDWYSPRGKSNERLRITIYILSRALRADSLSVRIEREEGAPGGWKPAPVAQQTVTDLENAILQRARQIHAETYQNETYEQLEKRS